MPLEEGTVVTIGRNPGSTIRVRNPSVSRNHARIIQSAGEWVVEDLGSSNHSFVNDEKVDKAPVKKGDKLRFGKCAVEVHEASDEQGKADAAPQGSAAERKKNLADERERRRLAREAKRAKRNADASSDAEPKEQPSRKRPKRNDAHEGDSEVETEPEVEVKSSAEKKPKRSKPTRTPKPESDPAKDLDDEEVAAPEESSEEGEGTEGVEEGSSPEEGESLSEVEQKEKPSRRPSSKPSRDSEMRQRRRNSGERKAAAEARQQSAASKRVDPGFNKDLREAQSRAGEMELDLRKAERRVVDLEARLKEVETRDARHEEELDGWHERYNRVREQLAHQGELLERAKVSLAERDEELASAEAKVGQLGGELAAVEGARAESSDLMSELKARVVQKDRRIDELQRELDLMEFDLRESREEIEGLVDERNGETGDQRRLARVLELLRELNAEKENVVAERKLELEERSRELYDAKMGSGIKDLEEARRDVLEQFFEKNREVDELEEKLKGQARELQQAREEIEELEERLVAKRDLSSHPDFQRKQRELERSQADLEHAEEAIERLEAKLQEFGPEARAKLDAEVNFLERKNKALQERVNSLQEQGEAEPSEAADVSTPGDSEALDALRESASEHLEDSLDDYADLKSNLLLLKTYLEEARDAVAEEGDVEAAFESIEELLKVVGSEANAFRRQLVRLKDLFDES